MTRILTRGFESGLLDEEADAGNNHSIVTSPVRTGTYALRVGNNSGNYARWSIPATDVIYAGWAFRTESISNNLQNILFVKSSNSNLELEANLDHSLNVARGSTVLATSAGSVWQFDTWHYIEMYIYIANASGRAVVKVDGNTVIDFTGDTQENSDADLTQFELRPIHNSISYVDDVVVNDDAGSVNNTYPGIISLEPVFPDSAGDTTQLQRGGTDSGNNWDQVDEQPADGVSYVYDTVVDDNDLYNLADFTLPAGASISNVIVQARAQIDSGAGNMRVMLKAGTTEAEGSTEVLAASYKILSQEWDVNPDDSGAWEEADIDALQIGVKVK